MGRVQRSSLPDGYFHVAARGVASTRRANGVATARRVYIDDEDRQTFLRLMRHASRDHGWTCHAFCLMGTHYHLVLDARREGLSAGLHLLNWAYTRYFNEKHGRFGHVFADRFAARVIESEDYLFDACAYVVQNPVQAGLCERAEDWPWSYSRYGVG